MKKVLTMNWDDTVNQSSSNSFKVVGSDIDADILMNGLLAITNAGLKSYSINQTYERGVDAEIDASLNPDDTQEFNTVDQKLVYTYMEDDGTELKSHTIEIPAPKAEHFELVVNQGKRLKQEIGLSLAATLEAATGNPITYKEGWFKSDK